MKVTTAKRNAHTKREFDHGYFDVWTISYFNYPASAIQLPRIRYWTTPHLLFNYPKSAIQLPASAIQLPASAFQLADIWLSTTSRLIIVQNCRISSSVPPSWPSWETACALGVWHAYFRGCWCCAGWASAALRSCRTPWPNSSAESANSGFRIGPWRWGKRRNAGAWLWPGWDSWFWECARCPSA